MKNENLNELLLGEKIELFISDEAKYQEVALLVDRSDFLAEVHNIRQELGLIEPLANFKKDFSKLFADGWKKIYLEWKNANSLKNKSLYSGLKVLLRRLKKPDYLIDVALQAIFFKVVIDYSGLVRTLGENSKFEDATVAIFPTVNTTKEQIMEAWRKSKEIFEILPNRFNPPNNRQNIKPEFRRNRTWYWQSKADVKYKIIAEKWNKEYYDKDETGNTKCVGYDDVAQGIKTYSDLLK